jgi:hypothetical protein
MIWLGVVIIILGAIIIYLTLPGGKLWCSYLKDVKSSFAETAILNEPQETFTEESISELPGLLQKHIVNGGYLDQPLMDNMHVKFFNTEFWISPDRGPIKINYQQVNFTRRPDRHAFLAGTILGIPLQVKDTVMDGVGSMTGILAKQFRLFDSTGAEMNQSQLITALSDAVIMPSLFLQDYVSYTMINDCTVETEIIWNGVSAKGQFTFNENGDIIRFDTNDRYMDQDGQMILTPWYVTYDNYEDNNGFWQVSSAKAGWMLTEGDHVYFKSDKFEISYSLSESDLGKLGR